MSNIKLLKLLTGEDVLAEVLPSSDAVVRIKNPLRVLILENKAAFVKWAELSVETEMTLQPMHVVAVLEPIQQMREQYQRAFSKVIAPQSGLILPS